MGPLPENSHFLVVGNSKRKSLPFENVSFATDEHFHPMTHMIENPT